MEKDPYIKNFDFFKVTPKKKFDYQDLALTVASFFVFMTSFVFPAAYFQNHKEIPITIQKSKLDADIMKCEQKSEISCYSEPITFSHSD